MVSSDTLQTITKNNKNPQIRPNKRGWKQRWKIVCKKIEFEFVQKQKSKKTKGRYFDGGRSWLQRGNHDDRRPAPSLWVLGVCSVDGSASLVSTRAPPLPHPAPKLYYAFTTAVLLLDSHASYPNRRITCLIGSADWARTEIMLSRG